MPGIPDEAFGYVAMAVAIVCNGSFAVPAKWKRVVDAEIHPIVYQTNKSFWCFVTSWLVLLIPGVDFHFTPYGMLSALFWVPSGAMAIGAVNYAGLAIAQATWSTLLVCVAFFSGVVLFQEPIHSLEITAAAFVGMLISMVGMAFYSDPSRAKARRGDVSTPTLVADADRMINSEPECASADVTTHHGSGSAPSCTRSSPLLSRVDQGSGRGCSDRTKGLLLAVCMGLYGGSFATPMKLAQRANPGTALSGLDFVISFGVGAGVCTLGLWAVYLLIGVRCLGYRWPSLNMRVMLGPGAIAGLTWSLGNIASIYTVMSLGEALGYSACAGPPLVVSGLWGIVYFREVSGVDALIWMMFALLCAISLVFLAFQLHSSSGGHPSHNSSVFARPVIR